MYSEEISGIALDSNFTEINDHISSPIFIYKSFSYDLFLSMKLDHSWILFMHFVGTIFFFKIKFSWCGFPVITLRRKTYIWYKFNTNTGLPTKDETSMTTKNSLNKAVWRLNKGYWHGYSPFMPHLMVWQKKKQVYRCRKP